MALDATVAGASANSYLTVATADALASNDYGPDAETWQGSGLEQKERALKTATLQIDDAVRSSWSRYSTLQALSFPRTIDYAGAPAVAFIPSRIARAAYYQAAFLIRNARVIAAADTRRARGNQSVSEPNMSYTRAEDGSPVLSARTMAALEGLLATTGSRGIHSVRMSSGGIA